MFLGTGTSWFSITSCSQSNSPSLTPKLHFCGPGCVTWQITKPVCLLVNEKPRPMSNLLGNWTYGTIFYADVCGAVQVQAQNDRMSVNMLWGRRRVTCSANCSGHTAQYKMPGGSSCPGIVNQPDRPPPSKKKPPPDCRYRQSLQSRAVEFSASSRRVLQHSTTFRGRATPSSHRDSSATFTVDLVPKIPEELQLGALEMHCAFRCACENH